MGILTDHRPFTVRGESFLVVVGPGITTWRSRLLSGRRELAREQTRLVDAAADWRNHRMSHPLPDGSVVEVECGWVDAWTVGIAVRVDGALVHESHPGKSLNWLQLKGQKLKNAQASPSQLEQQRRDREQWARNKPSILVDIALGLLFFAVSKLTGSLTTAALVGAAAGLSVVVAQRFVKVDLLGGLALFGVLTLLVSAGFSLWFQDERIVQLKGTVMGAAISCLVLLDWLLNRARYFGARMARYIPGPPVDERRLVLGVALLGLAMASVNLAVTQWLSKDAWLVYTTFLDTPLAIALTLLVFRFARSTREAAIRA